MGKAGRVTLAVVAGASVWALLWNAGTLGAQAALPELMPAGQPITHTGALLGLIAYCVVLSMVAGYTTLTAAGRHSGPALRILAALQMTLGLVFEIAFWKMTPVWYHIIFLAVVIPATLYGGFLRGSFESSARGTSARFQSPGRISSRNGA